MTRNSPHVRLVVLGIMVGVASAWAGDAPALMSVPDAITQLGDANFATRKAAENSLFAGVAREVRELAVAKGAGSKELLKSALEYGHRLIQETLNPDAVPAAGGPVAKGAQEGELAKIIDLEIKQCKDGKDLDVRDHLHAMLKDQDLLLQWALGATAVKGTDTAEFWDYALSPEVMPALRTALMCEPDRNMEIKMDIDGLLAQNGKQADMVLTTLLKDADAARVHGTLEALSKSDRAGSEELSMAVWEIVQPLLASPETAMVRLPGPPGPNGMIRGYKPPSNLPAACRILASYHTEAVGKAFEGTLSTLGAVSYAPGDAQAVSELALGFKSTAMMDFVYEHGTVAQQYGLMGRGFTSTNRTPMIAAYLLMNNLSPGDYGLIKNTLGDREIWGAATAEAEKSAVEKAKAWHDAKKDAGK